MKGFTRFLFVSVVVTMVAGCASDIVYIPKIPSHAQAKLLDYYEQPDNKVFIIAIDPGGNYAFGYDYGKSTLKEAARVAVERCDASRESHGITAKAYIYAINNKVVYEGMIRKSQQDSEKEEPEVQTEELEEEDAEVNPDAVQAVETDVETQDPVSE